MGESGPTSVIVEASIIFHISSACRGACHTASGGKGILTSNSSGVTAVAPADNHRGRISNICVRMWPPAVATALEASADGVVHVCCSSGG